MACIVAPAWPLMLNVWFPRGVLALVVIVTVEFFEVASVMLTEAGSKFALTPAGRPLALRFTAPVKPAKGVTVTEYCAAAPGVIFLDAGVTLRKKSGVVEAGAEATKVK